MATKTSQDSNVVQFKRGAKDKGLISGDASIGSIISSEDFEKIFSKLGYQFIYNEVLGVIEVNHGEMTDEVMSSIRLACHELDDSESFTDLSSSLRIHDAISVVAQKHSIHPIKFYLDMCAEQYANDDTDYLDKLVENMPGCDHGMTYLWLKKWLIGNVARVYEGFQNYTLVIKGPQGIGKSQLAAWLTSGLQNMTQEKTNRYFVESSIDTRNKDHFDLLATKWIWAVDEIGASIRHADRCAFKAFLSTNEITIRRAYARYATTRPRICSLIASTNEDEFLDDPTGTRRFLVIDLPAIDWSYSNHYADGCVDVSGLWGQVMRWYRHGERPELTREEKSLQASQNEQNQKRDPVEDWLENTFEMCDDRFISSEDLLALAHQNRLIGTIDKGSQMRVSELCKKLGFMKVRNGFIRGYRIKSKPGKTFGSVSLDLPNV